MIFFRSLKQSIDAVCSRMGTVGLTYIQAANYRVQEAQKILAFADAQRDKRKVVEDNIK